MHAGGQTHGTKQVVFDKQSLPQLDGLAQDVHHNAPVNADADDTEALRN